MSTNNRIRLVVAYDGTDYYGWAVQRDRATVRSTLTETVRQVSGEKVEIIGASRTDSGAHAAAQVCHFDSNVAIPPAKWKRALDDLLPRDISIVRSELAEPDFHSRHWATARTYRYRYLVGSRDALRARFAQEVRGPLDLDAMQAAAQSLLGERDFKAYSEEVEPHEPTRRFVERIEVQHADEEVWLTITANAFVRGMMRRIAGCLLEIGRGKRPVVEAEMLLDERRRNDLQWPVVLPAWGLCLMKVRYEAPKRTEGDTPETE